MSIKIEILEYELNGVNIDWEKSILGELDITDSSDFPLALTFQISDIKDITATSGDYSKTFKIPATNNNNNLLKHLYIPNIVNEQSPTKNLPCRITINGLDSLVGIIKVTGVGGYGERVSYYNCLFYGNNLDWANLLEGKYMDTIDWSGYGDDLVYQKTEIMATWQDEHSESSTSPLVYPITSYGAFNFSVEDATIQLLDNASQQTNVTIPNGSTGYTGFDDSGTPYGNALPSPDWRPALFVKTTLENIFQKIGYTITSDFINTDMFKKLVWVLPNFKYNNEDDRYTAYSVETGFLNEAELDVVATAYLPVINEFGVELYHNGSISEDDGDTYYNGGNQPTFDLSTSGTTKNLQVNLDDGNWLDLATDEITIGEFGYYNLKLNGLRVKCARVYKGGTTNENVWSVGSTINIERQTVGQGSWVVIGQMEKEMNPTQANGDEWVDQSHPSFTDYIDIENFQLLNYYFNKGDKIKLSKGMRVDAQDSSQNFNISIFWEKSPSASFNLEFAPNRVEYGQTYSLDKVLNKDYKQIDFIKGISHAFNLNLTTDTVNKNITIEPFNDFYKPYTDAIDWTYKLDKGREIKDKFLKSDLKRKFIFKYKSDDKDESVKYRGATYFQGVEDEYPYQEELDSNFERGESIFENPFFAGTYNAKDQQTVMGTPSQYIDNMFSACLWQEKENGGLTFAHSQYRPSKGFDFLPRLLYWNKYSPAAGIGNTHGKFAIVTEWNHFYRPIVGNSVFNLYVLSTIYPQATSINRDDSTSPVLSYGNVWVRDYVPADGTYSSPMTKGKGLYETYYRNMFEMFKQNPRVRSVYVDIKTSDILSLDFRKLIYIDGFYWRLNKISDFMPHKNESTKVELVEWFETGVFAAAAPAFGVSTASTGGGIGWGNSPIGGDVIDDQNFGG